MNIADLTARAREILKALAPEDKEATARVPVPPEDPDAIEPDPRVGDASPEAEEIEEAGEEAEAGEPEGAEGGEEPAPEEEPEEPAEKAFAEDGNEEFDAHGNRDMDPEELRSMAKAYGNGTGLAEPEELAKGGLDLEGTLSAILNVLEDQNAVIKELRSEMTKLKAGSKENERKLAKAFETLGDLRVPVPAGPKAITKALPEPPAGPVVNPADKIYTDLKAGRMSHEDAMRMCRELRAGV